MRRKSKTHINRIASAAGALTQDLYSTTQNFVKDISKEISEIDWERMYKNTQKSLRLSIRKGNKALVRTMKKARKTDTYKVLSRDIPMYLTQFRVWSTLQLRKLQNFAASRYHQSRLWIMQKYPNVRSWTGEQFPRVKSFVKQYSPRFENYVLNQIPVYRIIFAK